MEVGAVSVMLYCFRERELLLNINEMLAGFRMFPSYMRVGGLREDLPRGFHDAVRRFSRPVSAEARRVRGPADPERRSIVERTQHVGKISKEDAMAYGLVGPDCARRRASRTTSGSSFPYLGLRRRSTSMCPVADRTATRYARYLVRVAEMRQSVKICRQALERITPTGVVRDRRSANHAAAARTASTPRWKR